MDYADYRDKLVEIFNQETQKLPRAQDNRILLTKDTIVSLAPYMVGQAEELMLDQSDCDSYIEFRERYGFTPMLNIFIYHIVNDTTSDVSDHYLMILEEIGKSCQGRPVHYPFVDQIIYVEASSDFH